MWILERASVPTPLTRPSEAERRLRADVERWAVPRHAFVNRAANRMVRDEIAGAFAALDLTVALVGPHENVLALPRERTAGRPLTLIAAHYDSVPHCPGADDNASGVAVMMECARSLAGAHDVGFVAFNREEDGLVGSLDFVAETFPTLGFPLRAAHVLEMVGFRKRDGAAQALPLPGLGAAKRTPDFIGVLGKGATNGDVAEAVGQDAAPGLRVLGAKTWGPMHRVFPDLTQSDHFAFWQRGLPATLWTDTAYFRNPNYHQPTDTPDTLDYAFMRDVAELLVAVVRARGAR